MSAHHDDTGQHGTGRHSTVGAASDGATAGFLPPSLGNRRPRSARERDAYEAAALRLLLGTAAALRAHGPVAREELLRLLTPERR